MSNDNNYPELSDSVKYIFDEIAAELADALRNLKEIENGVPQARAKKLSYFAANQIRRAGRICGRFGIGAETFLKNADSN
jgi:hypothetical protein